MPHRSALLAFLAALLLLPATAQAADPVVAGPLPDGATATAKVERDSLCVSVRVPGRDFDDAGCDPLPVLGPLGFADGLSGYEGGAGIYDAGVTGTDVAAVELRKDGRTLAHVATQPSTLPGAGDLRFYLIAAQGATPDEVAYLDAAGTVRRATDVSGSAFFFGAGEVPQTAQRTLARGSGLHGGHWTLTAYGTRGIVSTPLQPERRLPEACVDLRWSAGGERGYGGACDQPGLEGSAVLLPELTDDGCGAFGRYTGALVRARVARLVAVLGDGTRRAVALHALPAGLGEPGLRAGVVVVSTREAVRSLVAYDAAGRAIQTDPVRAAPRAPRPCDAHQGGDSFGESIFEFGPGNPDTVLGAAPHALDVADDGARICFAADRAPVVPSECVEAPVDPSRTFLWAQPAAGGRFVYGIVPPEIATARLTLDDGSTRDLPTRPIAGYSGQYAAVLREVAGDVPGPHRAVAFRLLDARGRTLAASSGPDFPAFGHARALGHVPGLGTVYASAYAVARSVPVFGTLSGCVSVGRLVPDTARQRCLPTTSSEVLLTPSCATRRTVVSVALAHRGDRVSVVLASGREVALPTLALPAPHRRYDGVALAVGVLGPHDAPRAVVRRGRSPRRLAVSLPAAGAQCGYFYDEPLDAPDFD